MRLMSGEGRSQGEHCEDGQNNPDGSSGANSETSVEVSVHTLIDEGPDQTGSEIVGSVAQPADPGMPDPSAARFGSVDEQPVQVRHAWLCTKKRQVDELPRQPVG
jgi:hypothetical protein